MTMEAKFTPGPWIFCEGKCDYMSEISNSCFYIRDEKSEFILAGTVGDVEELQVEEEANAYLISAAPEMYEALRDLLDCHAEGGFVEPNKDVLSAATRALAKAEGRNAEG